MGKEEITKCDVCANKIDHRDHYHNKPRTMQMLRNFDSCDGRSFYKHLVTEDIYICKSCINSAMNSGRYLIDNRVQGYGDINLTTGQGEEI